MLCMVQPSAPHEQEGEGHACEEYERSRDACGGKDDGVLKHGMVHDEVVVDIVGFTARDEPLLFQFKHYGRAVAYADDIAYQPHVRGMAGQAEEAHERGETQRELMKHVVCFEQPLDDH